MVAITFIAAGGAAQTIDASEGLSLMENAIGNGIEAIEAVCSGNDPVVTRVGSRLRELSSPRLCAANGLADAIGDPDVAGSDELRTEEARLRGQRIDGGEDIAVCESPSWSMPGWKILISMPASFELPERAIKRESFRSEPRQSMPFASTSSVSVRSP